MSDPTSVPDALAAQAARQRVRARPTAPRPSDAPTPATDDPEPSERSSEDEAGEGADPRVARLRTVLEMTAAGVGQRDIAAALNCTSRTVRNLLAEARRRQLQTFKARSAEVVVADAEHKSAVQYARWMRLLARARRAGDLRAEAYILSKVDQHLATRIAILGRVGYFARVEFVPPTTDEGERRRQRDRAEVEFMVALSAAALRGDEIDDAFSERLAANVFDDTTEDENTEPLYG